MAKLTSSRPFAVLLLLLGSSSLVFSGKNLEQIVHTDDLVWDIETAKLEVKGDVDTMVQKFDQFRPKLVKIVRQFQVDLEKDEGIRKLAIWGVAFAQLLELHAAPAQDEALYDRLVDSAMLLLSVRKTALSYVEGKVLRGWPMRVGPNDDYPIYEGNVAPGYTPDSKQS